MLKNFTPTEKQFNQLISCYTESKRITDRSYYWIDILTILNYNFTPKQIEQLKSINYNMMNIIKNKPNIIQKIEKILEEPVENNSDLIKIISGFNSPKT